MEKELLYPDCDFSIWFRSIDQTGVTEVPIEGRKIGTIPGWINGCFYQNGPGVFHATGARVEHIFDAFSLIQKFTVKDGRVTYQNRILQSEAYKRAYETGQAWYSEYGTSRTKETLSASKENEPSESTFNWILSRIRNFISPKSDFRTDNAMISIYPYKVKNDEIALFAMTETPIMHEIDKRTIETRSSFNSGKYLSIVTNCAHPIILADGTIWNVGLTPSITGMSYVLFEFPSSSKVDINDNLMTQCRVLAKIPCRWPINPSYMHAFAVSENYVILIEQSLCVSLAQMAQLTITNGPMTDALVWHGNEPTRFRIISRRTMTEYDGYTYLTPAFFYLHVINVYEDQNNLVLDVCTFDNSDMLTCMSMKALENAQQNPNYAKEFCSRPKRFVLPIVIENENEFKLNLNYTTCQVTFIDKNTLWIEPELIVDVGCELPQVDYSGYYGKFYRYFYAINTDVDFEHCGALRKVDVISKTCQIWYETGCYTSEPIFLRNPASKIEDEDNGVLIMALLRSDNENEVNFLVLNARNMAEIGRVQFDTNGPIPKNLHGLWVDSEVKNK